MWEWCIHCKSYNMLSPNTEEKVIVRIPVHLLEQPPASTPRTECLHHVHKGEIVVVMRNQSCCLDLFFSLKYSV